MKLYTKTGDKGKTGLIGGTRVLKSDVRLEAYGTVDELNSHIGVLMSLGVGSSNVEFLQNIQNVLFSVGAHLATDTNEFDSVVTLELAEIEKIENEIDKMSSELPPLAHFILPSGSHSASQSHVCRTVARRTERRIVAVSDFYPIDENIIKYINRLSDYFFILSRWLLKQEKKEEICWKKPK